MYDNYFDFDNEEEIEICPDFLVPMIGYESHILEMSEGSIRVKDFFFSRCSVGETMTPEAKAAHERATGPVQLRRIYPRHRTPEQCKDEI